MRHGIAAAGNMIVDHIYPISGYPNIGKLTTIRDDIRSVTGGIVCNVLVDLARLDPGLPLQALGIVGEDQDGAMILDELGGYANIDTSGVLRMGRSAFTTVMSDTVTSQRTFFVYRGSNAVFCEDHIDWDRVGARILHAGYILLMDALDRPDGEYGTKMARLLAHAQERGIRTSVDIVTEIGDRFKALVPPALRYTDYCIINEIEAQQSTGFLLRDDGGGLHRENMRPALEKLFDMGVSGWAVIHCPEGGFGMDRAEGRYEAVDSLRLPPGYVKGTVGAGDAFCAGVLYGAHEGMPMRRAIELGTACAACSLSEPGSTAGVRGLAGTMALYEAMR